IAAVVARALAQRDLRAQAHEHARPQVRAPQAIVETEGLRRAGLLATIACEAADGAAVALAPKAAAWAHPRAALGVRGTGGIGAIGRSESHAANPFRPGPGWVSPEWTAQARAGCVPGVRSGFPQF